MVILGFKRMSSGRRLFSASGSFSSGMRVPEWKFRQKAAACTPASVRLQPFTSGRSPSTASSAS